MSEKSSSRPNNQKAKHLANQADSNIGMFDCEKVSEFHMPQMDCQSEVSVIQMALEVLDPQIKASFDIPGRKVVIYHKGNSEEITATLESLKFGSKLVLTRKASDTDIPQGFNTGSTGDSAESGVLKLLLCINGMMFVLEMSIGWFAQSTGLIADSLDMLADAMVYGVALYAVGKSIGVKLKAAHLSGWLQLLLALGALAEVFRRFIFGSDPISIWMMGIGTLALVANVVCLRLIYSQKNSGVHMQASWIFSANDVIANLGVILAGILVALSGSRYPDLIIGVTIGVIVLNGARRILNLKS